MPNTNTQTEPMEHPANIAFTDRLFFIKQQTTTTLVEWVHPIYGNWKTGQGDLHLSSYHPKTYEDAVLATQQDRRNARGRAFHSKYAAMRANLQRKLARLERLARTNKCGVAHSRIYHRFYLDFNAFSVTTFNASAKEADRRIKAALNTIRNTLALHPEHTASTPTSKVLAAYGESIYTLFKAGFYPSLREELGMTNLTQELVSAAISSLQSRTTLDAVQYPFNDVLHTVQARFTDKTWQAVGFDGQGRSAKAKPDYVADYYGITHDEQTERFAPLWWHFAHVSKDDDTLVAYYPSIYDLCRDRPTKVKMGRYLTKHFGWLGEARIRNIANRYQEMQRPTPLQLVPNTNPDGWEWVYEHGTSFQSCMTYDRNDRFLDSEAEGFSHPVRCYAADHPDNHLALAFIAPVGSLLSTDDKVVTARCIVNTKTMTHQRIYGDDSAMRCALEAAGYSDDWQTTMEGQVMALMPYPHNGSNYFFAPYLDWGRINWLDTSDTDDDEDNPNPEHYVTVASRGTSTSSSGTVTMPAKPGMVPKDRCSCCHDETDEDDLYSVGPDGDEMVCEYCRDRHYTEVRRRISGCTVEIYCDSNAAIYCESDDTWYFNDYRTREYFDLVQIDNGDWYKIDDCTCIDGEWYHSGDCNQLDVEYCGDEYALSDNTVQTYDGRTIHENAAINVERNGETYTMHEDDDEDYLDENLPAWLPAYDPDGAINRDAAVDEDDGDVPYDPYAPLVAWLDTDVVELPLAA